MTVLRLTNLDRVLRATPLWWTRPVTGEYVLEGLAVPGEPQPAPRPAGAGRRGAPRPHDAPDLMMFETAVIEVAGNVVEHGRPPGRRRWAFRLSVHPDRLEAQLSDSGEEYPGGTWGTRCPTCSRRTAAGSRSRRVCTRWSYERATGRTTGRWSAATGAVSPRGVAALGQPLDAGSGGGPPAGAIRSRSRAHVAEPPTHARGGRARGPGARPRPARRRAAPRGA